uniref:Peptidase S8/S53 domain-containing protein n=1 Tax=Ananas comosus var. bracteatus TaxID=296719 RepID=A0A6V7NLQ8_ANACO|nr:unnamed protein product [Ananas comosus var. bracteatus]
MAKSEMPAEFEEHGAWYGASLRSVSDSAELLYAYDAVVHGSTRPGPGVSGPGPGPRRRVGLGPAPESNAAADVVVGVLDTGVWPERASFDDAGFGPVPAWWRGACESGADFNASSACNRKLVGARFFARGYEASKGPIDVAGESRSPRDNDGHGTHTASTAAGAAAPGASLLGYAAGTARGMAARARVAAYKVCWLGAASAPTSSRAWTRRWPTGATCSRSRSAGAPPTTSATAWPSGVRGHGEGGARVVLGGELGPGASTLSNVAPWITTVGAGTIDRNFPADVVLGDGRNYSGCRSTAAGPCPPTGSSRWCTPGTPRTPPRTGTCACRDAGAGEGGGEAGAVRPRRERAGAEGRRRAGRGRGRMVLANTAASGEELVADAHLLPATGVGQRAGDAIRAYLFSDPNPTATIAFAGTQVGVRPSPVVAAFSSRGPTPSPRGCSSPTSSRPG